MIKHDALRRLDDPSDEVVEILHEICFLASKSIDPPFQALFASYADFFAAHGLDTARDPIVFRWLMRVADRVRLERRNGIHSDYVRQLKSLLKDRGISILGEDQDVNEDDVTRSVGVNDTQTASANIAVRRRVSFDDARLEETWISEHSKSLNPVPHPSATGPSHHIPHRGKNVASAQIPRARSVSSQRGRFNQQPASEKLLAPSSSMVNDPEYEDQGNSVPLIRISETQLEENFEAFLAISELRMARHYLRFWYNHTLLTQGHREGVTQIAISHDKRTLLKQSLGLWRVSFQERRREQEYDTQLDSLFRDFKRGQDRWLLAKAFSHWDESARHQKRATAVAQRHAMKVKYFRRWRRIACENALKIRSIQTRKCLALWKDQVVRHGDIEGRAVLHHEKVLTKVCFQQWFWAFCSRRVDGWHEQQIYRRSFNTWQSQLGVMRLREQQAHDLRDQSLARRIIQRLASQLRHKQSAEDQANRHHDGRLALSCLQSLSATVQLAPLASTTSNRVDLDLLRKAMKVWRFQLSSSRKAAAVDRKRILRSAWTRWNDALRCKALTQRIDERVLTESLYKWVLQERLHCFEKATELRRVRTSLHAWAARYKEQRSALSTALALFKEQEQHHRTRSGLLHLYSVFRARENQDRTAVEFANTRALPTVLKTWIEKAELTRQMGQWATDARFYCLTTRTLQSWRTKTSEHKHNRRREAYAQIRSRWKYKIVKECFARWQAKANSLHHLYDEASQREQARLFQFSTGVFDTWREKAMLYRQLERQAIVTDNNRLQASVFSVLADRHADLMTSEEQADFFRQESDLALVSTTLKRVQWMAFTASRRTESADALWARNRDQHVRHMLRHLASEAGRRRTAKMSAGQHEPESPSLRPASRLAARAEPRVALDEATITPRTPAYMQTPTRSRRAGRFRPLPTPAMMTPMAFHPAYYVTNPGPLSAAVPTNEIEEGARHLEGLTPQITPFARKLRAGGITPMVPPSALRSSMFGNVGQGRNTGGTSKSVRFARSSRFSAGRAT